MTPEQYEKIGQLFHAAMELPPERRAAFLSGACSDAELRREVESLLTAHERAGDFVATPAVTIAAELFADRDDGADAAPVSGSIGAYEVLSLIGRGGMGEVYLAHDPRLGRNVAVKLLRPALTGNADASRRFEQEARAASSLNHPNIVTIHDIGDFGERRFIAMELVEGRSLTSMVGRAMDAATLARIGAQLAQALAVAHAAGIVHRDIKPENVIVRDDGYVKVLDFGLARLAAVPTVDSAHAGTSPSLLLGTPRYMSPEQARGETATAASDIFSLGVVLYELAAGAHPFERLSTLATLHAITSDAVARPTRSVPNMPATLERLLLWMLEKSAAARPRADQVEAELEKISRGQRRHDLNLPPQRTALVGRAAELASVKGLLLDSACRLMTLTGPGGTGKTRLAIQVAEDLAAQFSSHFPGGVAFVNLAPIADPRLVASAVAGSLGVRESGDLPLVAAIADHLRGLGPTLLVFDNFEQVSDAAALVKELLDACPALQVLVTSRVVLHIYGEREFPVPPLPLPPPGALFSPSTLMDCASIALFVQRAAAVMPQFSLTPKNAGAIVEICRRLDGLPLAIELAAARVKILPPADLLARIERPLELLTGGARDLPERQQTLRQTIKWSYDLLPAAEQRLFRRLAVFAGGCTLEGAEAVCNTHEDLGVEILDGVTSLVDNSLLVQRGVEEDEPRFVMLETFREYARERLLEHEEASATTRAHAAYMLVVAEEETLDMMPTEREAWLRCCDLELDNFRAAANSLIATSDAEWALRLGVALFRFWEQRDHLTEGRETLARVLAMPGAAAPTRLRARALYCASVLADIQSDSIVAQTLGRESYNIYRAFNDTQGVATTMTVLGYQAQRQGRYAEATSLFGESVSLWAQLGDLTAVDLATINTAHAAKLDGNFDLARQLLEQVVAASRARGDVRGIASALNGLGDVAASEGDLDRARNYHYDSLVTYREIDDRWGMTRVLSDLANVDLQAGRLVEAETSLKEAVHVCRTLGHQRGIARQLEALSSCAGSQGRDASAVLMASAAAAIRQRIGAPAKQNEREKIERTLAQARERISANAYASAWQQGRSATIDQILADDAAAPRGL